MTRPIAFAILTVLFAGVQPASAQREGPWCAHVGVGIDSTVERCDMRSLDMCLAEIRGQGSSHCSQNPRYQAAAPEPRERQRRSQKRQP